MGCRENATAFFFSRESWLYKRVCPSLSHDLLQTCYSFRLKNEFSSCIVLLHKNVHLLGSLDSNVNAWRQHDLVRCYLETSLQIKLPSLPCGRQGDYEGFLYTTERQKAASYFCAMDTLGELASSKKNRLTDKRTNGKKFSFLFFFF